MKRLILAIAAAATTLFAPAAVTQQLDFESNGTAYDENVVAPSTANYPFAGFGDKYLELDDTFSAQGAGGTVFDMYVQFTAMTETPSLPSGAKIAVYADGNGSIHVLSDDDYLTDGSVTLDQWARLTIAAADGGYKVYLNGAGVTAMDIGVFPEAPGADTNAPFVEFTGSGKLDNFVARTTDPFGGAPTGWIAKELNASDPEQYYMEADYTAALTAALNGTSITFNDGMDGTAAHPFKIRSADDLKALADAVNAGKSAGKCFVQTDDIDMSEAGAFAGIGVYNAIPTNGVPFAGTYDGGNFTISNVTMTARNYGGIFNQVNGGMIKNLTVENISTAATSGEFGYAIVGNAGNGATLENLTAAGTFLSSEKPGTHNMAGIVVRACGGGENGTLIKNCTNAATIYGAYTKMAGICAIAQHKVDGGPVTFDGCSNTGTLTMPSGTTAGRDGLAGIIGYVNDDTVLKGCSNTGSMTSTLATAKIGQLVGWAYSHKLTLNDAGTLNANDENPRIAAFNSGATVAIAWDPGSKQKFVFNDFGNANSIVEIVGANNAFNAFPSTTMGTDASAPTINPAIVLSCNWTITDGWKGTTTTIPKLSGTGNLTINDSYLRYYSIGTVDGYSGTITTGKHIVKYGNIVNTGAGFDTCLVKAGATFAYDLTDAQLNGAATALAVGTVNEQKGIYLARATVNDAGYMTVAEAITAANTAKVSSVTVYDGSSDAVEGWSYDNGVYSRYIAKVGDDPYTTLEAAIAAADEGETKTVELIYTCAESVTIPAGVTVNSLTTANDFHGTIAGAGTLYYAQTPSAAPTATDDFTGEVVIGYNWSSNADLKWYGGSNSTIVVTSFTGSNTYFPAKEKILSKVRVAEGGEVAINNGWNISLNNFAWTADRVVEIPALKVDGTFSLAYTKTQWNGDSYGAFYVKSLDASGTGSITVGNRFALRIDAVDFAEAPSGKNALVNLTLTGDKPGLLYGPNGDAGEQIPVTVNGVATEQTLVYDAAKGGLVLYVAPIAFIYDENGNLLQEIPAGDNAVMQAAMAFLQMDIGESIKFASSIENTDFHAMFLAGCTYDATTFTYTRKHEAAVAKITVGQKDYTFPTLAAAIEAALDGETVVLLDDIAVTEMQCISGKAMTLDLAGFAITAGERSAEAATAGDDSILCVLHGGSLTINDSSAGGTGAITGNSVFTTGVKMTKKGDTDDTNKATLVVNGGTITGYYYGIAGNGLAGRGNTEVTINGGSVYGTCVNDSVAIFQPQLGTLTINGGYLEGAMGVYVKSGTATVAINGGTIKGNGTYAAYVHSTNGFNNTGDAFVVDNAGYPGGAPAPSILGGTFVSINASAIASYAKTGLERIVHFADKDAVTITEAKASSEDVFLEKGFPGGSDGKTFTIDDTVQTALEAKLPAGKALTDTVEGTTSGLTYAQAYALGLFDEDTETVEDVKPTIEIVDGKVVVSLDATAKAGYKVMLNVYEKSSLTAQWPAEPTKSYELDSAAEAAGFAPSAAGAGFYKVGVTIEDAE